MCGITGALDPDSTLTVGVLETLNAAQCHRGPDHDVVVTEGPFSLGNTRLAIQDPTPRANQPFRDPTGRYLVVFNGEIYNFHELIRQHALDVTTGCDGEIIPLLFARMGPACLSSLRGMFAIAVADLTQRRLFLARDPFGIKPLCWRRVGSAVAFASEVRPLWNIDRALKVDESAITQFLRWGSVPADQSIFDGMESVAPGSCVSFSLDEAGHVSGPRLESCNAPIDGPIPVSKPMRSISLSQAFRESVRLHLLADVPTALLLSAGVDSTLIALAARDVGETLHCLTVVGAVGEDESAQARATALEYGHTHEVVPAVLDASTVAAFLAAMQQPTIDGLNTFLVSRSVHAAGFKLALSGLGGDEALGGYDHVSALRFLPTLRFLDRIPGHPLEWLLRTTPGARFERGSGKVQRLIASDGPRTPRGIVDLQRELFSLEVVEALVGGPVEDPQPRSPQSPRWGYPRMAAAEVERYLQPMLLPDADAFSMASSVELRVPFVDVPFFDVALRRRNLRGKSALVEEMDNPYLNLLSKRPKTGFALPMVEWLRSGALRGVVDDAMDPNAPVWNHLDPTIGRPLLESVGTTPRFSEPWAIAVLDGWLRSIG